MTKRKAKEPLLSDVLAQCQHVHLVPNKAYNKARKLLKEVERELKADWLYHDWDGDAVEVIRELAVVLRAIVGPDKPKKEKPR